MESFLIFPLQNYIPNIQNGSQTLSQKLNNKATDSEI